MTPAGGCCGGDSTNADSARHPNVLPVSCVSDIKIREKRRLIRFWMRGFDETCGVSGAVSTATKRENQNTRVYILSTREETGWRIHSRSRARGHPPPAPPPGKGKEQEPRSHIEKTSHETQLQVKSSL